MEQLISASQAAQVAGVSLNTFERYQSIGALNAVSQEGQALFDIDEVKKIFGVDDTNVDLSSLSRVEPQDDQQSDAQIFIPEADQELPPFSADSFGRRSFAPPRPSLRSQVEIVHADGSTSEPADSRMDVELLRQVTINKHLRGEIEELRGERDWLRGQLERLESRCERDQMLMMSNLETIRNLSDEMKKRRSIWQRALPWLGKS